MGGTPSVTASPSTILTDEETQRASDSRFLQSTRDYDADLAVEPQWPGLLQQLMELAGPPTMFEALMPASSPAGDMVGRLKQSVMVATSIIGECPIFTAMNILDMLQTTIDQCCL